MRSIHNNCIEFSENEQFFAAAASWSVYGGALRTAIHALKYHQDLGLGDYFAQHLIKLLVEKNWNFNLVVPVPLSREKRKERGYNQSALLSRPIAAFFNVEHSSTALVRTLETGSQVSRSRHDRYLALEGAFSGIPAKLKEKSVLLVDDIITTGATINHCAQALLQAEAASVIAISIAKTPRKSS